MLGEQAFGLAVGKSRVRVAHGLIVQYEALTTSFSYCMEWWAFLVDRQMA